MQDWAMWCTAIPSAPPDERGDAVIKPLRPTDRRSLSGSPTETGI